jgi:hypothetical protein
LAAPERLDHPVALRHVSVLTMTGRDGAPLHDQTVVVDGGRVVAVVPDGTYTAPVGREIDLTGKWSLPGLADMHVHMYDVGEAALYLANGVTTVRNMFGDPWHLAYRRRFEGGTMLGPRMVTTTPIVDGAMPETGRPMWPGSAFLTDPNDARRKVDQWMDRGYDQLKTYSFLDHDSLAALGKACADADFVLTGHCPRVMTFEEAMDRGQRCFEHLTNIQKGLIRDPDAMPPQSEPLARATYAVANFDHDGLVRLADRMAAADVWNCTTLVVWQGMGGAFDPASRQDPHLRFVTDTTLATWDPANDFRMRSIPAERHAEILESDRILNEWFLAVTSTLHDAGAPLLVGTDNPNPYVIPGFSVHDELDNFVRAGLTPLEAIEAATVAPARFLGEERISGIVSAGARADLVVTDRDPRSDLTTLRSPRMVLVNGFVLDRTELDAMLQRREAEVIARREALASAPPVALPARTQGPSHAGVIRSAVGGVAAGCCRFEHRNVSDGDGHDLIEIDEVELRSGESPSTRRVHLVVDRSAAIERARLEEEFEVGTAALDVERSADGGYQIRRTALDGWGDEREVDAEILVPSDRLALSALGLAATRSGPFKAIDPSGVFDANSDGHTLTFDRPDEESTMHVDVDDTDGRLRSARMDTWMGELVLEVTEEP